MFHLTINKNEKVFVFSLICMCCYSSAFCQFLVNTDIIINHQQNTIFNGVFKVEIGSTLLVE